MIVALDPGGSTGVAWAYYNSDWNFGAQTFGPGPHHEILWRWLHHLKKQDNNLTVVCESFEYRNRERPGLVLDSVEYIGIVKLFVGMTNTPLVSFNAATAKGFVKDKNLRRLGLFERGDSHRHERDAYRHLLYYMTNKLNNVDLLSKGWRGE